jgi:hypothetical protein
MICNACGHNNITKANYCENCGAAFTDEQRQKAYDKTVYGKIEKLEKIKGYLTIEAITSHPVFRIAVLVVILVVGLLVGRPHGNAMTILKNDAYSVAQNSQTGEYYLLTDREQVQVDLYFPKKTEQLTVTRGDQTDTLDLTANQAPVLTADAQSAYTLTADTGESITVYVIQNS